jgi:hypothetical protein
MRCPGIHFWPPDTPESIKQRYEDWQKALHRLSVLEFFVYTDGIFGLDEIGEDMIIAMNGLSPDYRNGRYKCDIKIAGHIYWIKAKGIN